MAHDNPTLRVPTTYYIQEHSVPKPGPTAEWRQNYEGEKKKLSDSWLQQVQWNTQAMGSETGPKNKRARKLHLSEAGKIKTDSPWAHWDSILQIAGLRPGIDLKSVITYLSNCRMMDRPSNHNIYITCKKRFARALKKIHDASWSDNFDGILKLPNQTELETIRILGEAIQDAPGLGYFPNSLYKYLKALGIAGMVAEDPKDATALLCWRASLRAVSAKMGYHSLDKLGEDYKFPLPTSNDDTVIDLDDYCQQRDQLASRLDALVADDREQVKLKLKRAKCANEQKESAMDPVKVKLEKSDTANMLMELENSNRNNIEMEPEKSNIGNVEMELEKDHTIHQSLKATNDKGKAIMGLQHGNHIRDQGQQPAKDNGSRHSQADIQLELKMSDDSSSDSSEGDDLVKRQDDILKYQERRIKHLESAIKKRKTRASQKDAEHKALAKRLQERIQELSDKNSALEQLLGNR